MTGKLRGSSPVALVVSTVLTAAAGTAQASTTTEEAADQKAPASLSGDTGVSSTADLQVARAEALSSSVTTREGAERSSTSRIHLAQAGQGTGQSGEGCASPDLQQGPRALESATDDPAPVTVVDAGIRVVYDPAPVTVLDADTLVANGQRRLQDYFTSVPGLSYMASQGRDLPTMAIRGIISGAGVNPTIGVTVDDLPIGSTTAIGGGYVTPDIDPSELSRVEVLRGPQGAIHGANAMGGLIRYVTADPSTDALTGRVESGVDGVDHGSEPGYSARGTINIPVSDSFAVRANVFTRRDAGYIDAVAPKLKGVNEVDVYGGRLAALWKPVEGLSVKFSALLQRTEQYGSSYVDSITGSGGFLQLRAAGTGLADKNFQVYSVTVNAKFGAFDLTSVSGYSVNSLHDTLDQSSYNNPYPTFIGALEADRSRVAKYTEELRLSTALGSHVDWQFGLFYTRERADINRRSFSINRFTGADLQLYPPDVQNNPTTYEEYAAFADITLKLTERFDVQIGGRESQNRQTYDDYEVGFFLTGNPYTLAQSSKDNSFSYLVTPRLKLVTDGSSNLMLYARLASGYRPGGPNTAPPAIQGVPTGVPATFGPDTTRNYEIGVKADTFERKLLVDASFYYIDWNNIQIAEATKRSIYPLYYGIICCTYYGNGARAKSQGVELLTEVTPVKGLTVGLSGAWDYAVLTAALPSTSTVSANPGDPLPFTARGTGSFNVQEDLKLGWALLSLGGRFVYVGPREGLFGSGSRVVFPGYAEVDLRAGLRWSAWGTELYANNVTNRRGELSSSIDSFLPLGSQFIQPLTAGITVAKTF
jgi:outer membrane receptor protein involved in Fe transport